MAIIGVYPCFFTLQVWSFQPSNSERTGGPWGFKLFLLSTSHPGLATAEFVTVSRRWFRDKKFGKLSNLKRWIINHTEHTCTRAYYIRIYIYIHIIYTHVSYLLDDVSYYTVYNVYVFVYYYLLLLIDECDYNHHYTLHLTTTVILRSPASVISAWLMGRPTARTCSFSRGSWGEQVDFLLVINYSNIYIYMWCVVTNT